MNIKERIASSEKAKEEKLNEKKELDELKEQVKFLKEKYDNISSKFEKYKNFDSKVENYIEAMNEKTFEFERKFKNLADENKKGLETTIKNISSDVSSAVSRQTRILENYKSELTIQKYDIEQKINEMVTKKSDLEDKGNSIKNTFIGFIILFCILLLIQVGVIIFVKSIRVPEREMEKKVVEQQTEEKEVKKPKKKKKTEKKVELKNYGSLTLSDIKYTIENYKLITFEGDKEPLNIVETKVESGETDNPRVYVLIKDETKWRELEDYKFILQ